MDPKQLAILLDQIIDDQMIPGMEGAFINASKRALADIIALLNDLDLTRGGQIKPTTKNLKVVQRVKNQLNLLIFNADYEQGLDEIKSGFETAVAQIDAYLFQTFDGFEPNTRMKTLVELAIEGVQTSIGANGLGATVANTVSNQMTQAVTSGVSLRDLIAGISDTLTRDALLQVSRFNIKQIVTDAIGAMTGQYLKTAGDRLGLQWYQVVGGKIKTTRDFCRVRDGKYYHKNEIEQWAKLDWDGKMEGTNSVTIFINRGGWNCRHEYYPVDAIVVPDKDKQRYADIRSGKIKIEVETT